MGKLKQWQKVKEIIGSALERPAAERRAYLDQVCAYDSELRAEVESLLSAYRDSDALLESVWPDLSAASRNTNAGHRSVPLTQGARRRRHGPRLAG